MPGWYCNESRESIHDDTDMKVSDRVLTELKTRVKGRQAAEAFDQLLERSDAWQ
ncbi:MAG: hypothetical protein GDA52_01335 [Rhodobacteraceae bacterium]|nr:hypothetical protein [Paracoccaceae bacterium]